MIEPLDRLENYLIAREICVKKKLEKASSDSKHYWLGQLRAIQDSLLYLKCVKGE